MLDSIVQKLTQEAFYKVAQKMTRPTKTQRSNRDFCVVGGLLPVNSNPIK